MVAARIERVTFCFIYTVPATKLQYKTFLLIIPTFLKQFDEHEILKKKIHFLNNLT